MRRKGREKEIGFHSNYSIMSNQSNIHSLALQDILLSIADSLNQAQQQLNNVAPYDQYGRPNTVYHLPYLDFTLKVFTEFETESSPSALPSVPNTATGGTKLPVAPGSSTNNKADKMKSPINQQLNKGSLIKFIPVTSSNAPQNNNSNVQIESVISGRFVAMLPNEGQAQMILSCQCTPPSLKPGSNNLHRFDLVVQVKNALNEPIAGSLVEFNFDAATSLSLNGAELQQRPVFSINEGLTNAQGFVSTSVEVGSVDYNGQKVFFFTVNSSNVFQHISVSKS